MKDQTEHYPKHVAELRQRYAEAMERSGFDHVILAAGQPHPVFMDDQHLPFKPNPYLLQWGPLREHPGSVLIVSGNAKPRLLVHAPDDYWHQIPPVPEVLAAGDIEISELPDRDAIRAIIAELTGRTGVIGEQFADADTFGSNSVNSPDLLAELDEQRTRKTAWEIANMQMASDIGVRGHLAARDCFLGGGSEYEIQLAFRISHNTVEVSILCVEVFGKV